MTTKTFALITSGTLVLTAPASAAFLGLVFEVYIGDGWIENGYNTSALVTYRLYADFDYEGDDGVLSAFGIRDVPMSANSTDGLFHNSPVGLDSLTAPEDLRFLGIWENQWDTYVTIGTDTAEGDATGLSPGFAAETNGLASDWVTENAGWFVTPDDGQSRGLPPLQLAQFTVAAGQEVFGTINLLLREGGQVEGLRFGAPAPGTLAVLILAQIVGSRRRRQ